MRVLTVSPHVFAGGAEKAVLYLAKNLNNLDCETSIATLSLDLTMRPILNGCFGSRVRRIGS